MAVRTTIQCLSTEDLTQEVQVWRAEGAFTAAGLGSHRLWATLAVPPIISASPSGTSRGRQCQVQSSCLAAAHAQQENISRITGPHAMHGTSRTPRLMMQSPHTLTALASLPVPTMYRCCMQCALFGQNQCPAGAACLTDCCCRLVTGSPTMLIPRLRAGRFQLQQPFSISQLTLLTPIARPASHSSAGAAPLGQADPPSTPAAAHQAQDLLLPTAQRAQCTAGCLCRSSALGRVSLSSTPAVAQTGTSSRGCLP